MAGIARAWEPQDLARVNDTVLRVAKLDGEFAWHQHRPVAEIPAVAILIERPETLQYGNKSP